MKEEMSCNEIQEPHPFVEIEVKTTNNPSAITTVEQLLDPLSVKTFIDSYLEKKILHLKRNNLEIVEGVFDINALEQCIHKNQNWHSPHWVRLFCDHEPKPIDFKAITGVHQLQEYLFDAFRDKQTIILDGAERYWPSAKTICQSIKNALKCLGECNIYATPPQSRAFDTHIDKHDVLILQTHGIRTWNLYAVDIPMPMQNNVVSLSLEPLLKKLTPDFGEPIQQVKLCPGDLLYLPRGVPHSTVKSDSAVMHMTFSLQALCRYELMTRLVQLLADKDIELRRRVPYAVCGFHEDLPSAGDLLRELAEVADQLEEPLDLRPILQLYAEQYSNPNKPDGALFSRINAGQTNLQTKLIVPEGATFEYWSAGHELRVRVGESQMSLPLKLQGILPFFQENRSFSIADLPDVLDDNAKLVLIRGMLEHGLFRIVSPESEM